MKAWGRLGARDRRALRWGVFVLAPALVVGFVVRPYAGALARERGRLVEQRALLQRELALVAAVGGYGRDEERGSAILAGLRPRLFAGRDDLAATTTLVGYVSDGARTSGVLVEEIRSRPALEAGPGVLGVELAVRGRSDLAGILRWLRALEGGAKLARVEVLSLTRASGGMARDSADTEVLTVGAIVRGYVLAPSGAR